ncbi:MAG: hypothetical protein LPK46_08105 [Bacteroidota bacterium]|nr:hypothetical protein [Bacteroidota bacterium]MDX5506087.1 hypothetical protein [Bacteroidota bacterium]
MKKSFILGGILLLGGCISDLDLEKFNDPKFNYDAHWIIPVAKATLTLEDVVRESKYVQIDPDNALRVVYRQDSLFTVNATDFSEIPNQDSLSFDVAVGLGKQTFSGSLGTLAGGQLTRILMGEGFLFWETDPVGGTGTITVELDNVTQMGGPVSFQINASPSGESGSIDISGMEFDLSQGSNPYNNLGFTMEIINSSLTPGSNIPVTFRYTDITVEEVDGYIGQRNISIPTQTIDLDLGGIEEFFDGLYLTDPKITLETVTNVGIPFNLTPYINGVNKNGQIKTLNAPSFNVAGAQFKGDWDTSKYVLNAQNSNVTDFISFIPHQIIAGGNVQTNPAGPAQNFITGNGAAVLNMEMDLPLTLRAENMRFEKDINDIDWGIDPDRSESIDLLTLHMKFKNSLPLQASVRLLMIQNGVAVDSVVVTDLLQAAQVDGQGRVQVPVDYRTSITLDQPQIDNLLRSKTVRFKAVFNTTNNGQTPVTFYSDYFLEVGVGLEAKLNVNVEDL